MTELALSDLLPPLRSWQQLCQSLGSLDVRAQSRQPEAQLGRPAKQMNPKLKKGLAIIAAPFAVFILHSGEDVDQSATAEESKSENGDEVVVAEELLMESKEVRQLVAAKAPFRTRTWNPELEAEERSLPDLIAIARGHVTPPKRRKYEPPALHGVLLLKRGMGTPGFVWMWHFVFQCELDRSVPGQAMIKDGAYRQEIALLPNGELVTFRSRKATPSELGEDVADPFSPRAPAEQGGGADQAATVAGGKFEGQDKPKKEAKPQPQ